MRVFLTILFVMMLTGCRDETVAGYGGGNTEWHLAELDGKAFSERAVLRLGDDGEISGDAPCNSYFGVQTAPYPWFSAEKIGATRRACPALEKEADYLQALSQMTLSEVLGDTLILSNDTGREMVFKAAP